MQSILIVFRREEARSMVGDALQGEYAVTATDTGEAALEKLEDGGFRVVVANDTLCDMSGEELANKARAIRPDVRVVITSTRENIDNAVGLLGPGEFVYVEKPLSAARIRHAVAIELDRAALSAEVSTLRARVDGMDSHDRVIIGSSMAIDHVRGRVKFVGESDAPALVTGESGTGKRLAAEAIHRASARADLPLVSVDCTSTPEDILERELFGFDRRDARGTVRRERGKIERARGGTLLIIEIGDLPAELQARLLQSLRESDSDVRVVATTRHDLRKRAGAGEFREDLFYAINVLGVEMPTLRERRADIPALAAHFIKYSAAKNAAKPVKLTPAAVEKLSNAAWPGNVRELQTVIERAVVLGAGGVVDAGDLRMGSGVAEGTVAAQLEHVFRTGSIREMEKLMILNRLKEKNDNRTRSAESLEISVRTLRNKLNEYNVRRRTPSREDQEPVVV